MKRMIIILTNKYATAERCIIPARRHNEILDYGKSAQWKLCGKKFPQKLSTILKVFIILFLASTIIAGCKYLTFNNNIKIATRYINQRTTTMNPLITFEKEYYKERCLKLLDNLLVSDFISINPYFLSDTNLEEFFKKRSNDYIQPQSYTEELDIVIHNFCTIGKNHGHTTNEYNGSIFNTAQISFGEENILNINYRQFSCKMRPITHIDENKITKPLINNYPVHSSIFGSNELIDKIFFKADNKQILYAYRFPVYDDYNKRRYCYRLFALFGNESDYYNILRKQFVNSQWFVLNHILKYTFLYAPMTRMYINGISGDWTVWPEPAKLFEEIFNKTYRTSYEKKLQIVSQTMISNNITPTDKF